MVMFMLRVKKRNVYGEVYVRVKTRNVYGEVYVRVKTRNIYGEVYARVKTMNLYLKATQCLFSQLFALVGKHLNLVQVIQGLRITWI